MEPQVHDYTIEYGQASIKVRRWDYLPTPEDPRLEGTRLRLEVIESSTGVPKELFVWERHSIPNVEQGGIELKDRFLCVAKVSDLSVYPVGNPDLTSRIPPFYRLSTVDLLFSSPEDFLLTWNDIRSDLTMLLKMLVELELLHAYPG